MQPAKQAGKHLRRTIKRRLLDHPEINTVRELARRVEHDEAVVSKAINHGKFPRVRAKIMEALNA